MREDQRNDQRRNDQRLMTNEVVPNPPSSTPETARPRVETVVAREHENGMGGLSPQERDRMRSRWTEIQVGFVDHPRQSVQEADQLVASAMQRLSDSFARTRSSLEGQWSRGEDVQTEELRTALQHYRSFFERLLGV
jgi:hypothetical protein